jgi:signal transduction histidine kinase
MVGVDAALLGRALSPLLDNAARFARSRVEVRLSTSRGVVVVQVQDDGPGFEPEVLPHAFEPGRRSVTADDHQGAGLGLALVRRLVTSAGGSVIARNGDGAVVELRLPAA